MGKVSRPWPTISQSSIEIEFLNSWATLFSSFYSCIRFINKVVRSKYEAEEKRNHSAKHLLQKTKDNSARSSIILTRKGTGKKSSDTMKTNIWLKSCSSVTIWEKSMRRELEIFVEGSCLLENYFLVRSTSRSSLIIYFPTVDFY